MEVVQHLAQALLHRFTLLQCRWLNLQILLTKTDHEEQEQATGISKQEGPVRVALFLNAIGREGVQMFDTFTFDEASHESANNLDHILAKYESRFLP